MARAAGSCPGLAPLAGGVCGAVGVGLGPLGGGRKPCKGTFHCQTWPSSDTVMTRSDSWSSFWRSSAFGVGGRTLTGEWEPVLALVTSVFTVSLAAAPAAADSLPLSCVFKPGLDPEALGLSAAVFNAAGTL